MFDPISPNYYKIDDDLELYHLTQWLMGNSAQSVQYLFRSTRIDGQWKDDEARIQDIDKAIFFSTIEKERLSLVKSTGKEKGIGELETPDGVKVMDITQWLPGNAAQAVFLLSRASMDGSPGSTESKVNDIASAIDLMEAEKKRIDIEIRHKKRLEGSVSDSTHPTEDEVVKEPEIEEPEPVRVDDEVDEPVVVEKPEVEEPEVTVEESEGFSLLDVADEAPQRGRRRRAKKDTLWSAQ